MKIYNFLVGYMLQNKNSCIFLKFKVVYIKNYLNSLKLEVLNLA